MQHMDDIQELQAQETLKRQSQEIFKHILDTRSRLFGVDPIENLSQEQLQELVDETFTNGGLNYIMIGNFNSHGSTQINLGLRTRKPFENIDEVTELLNIEVDAYLRNLEQNIKECKATVYEHLRAYQDEQNRKKQDNPFK